MIMVVGFVRCHVWLPEANCPFMDDDNPQSKTIWKGYSKCTHTKFINQSPNRHSSVRWVRSTISREFCSCFNPREILVVLGSCPSHPWPSPSLYDPQKDGKVELTAMAAMLVSWNRDAPKIIHLSMRVFSSKQTILGEPYFRNPPRGYPFGRRSGMASQLRALRVFLAGGLAPQWPAMEKHGRVCSQMSTSVEKMWFGSGSSGFSNTFSHTKPTWHDKLNRTWHLTDQSWRQESQVYTKNLRWIHNGSIKRMSTQLSIVQDPTCWRPENWIPIMTIPNEAGNLTQP